MRNVVACFKLNKRKCSILSDGIVNVKLINEAELTEVRVTGINMVGQRLRVVMPTGGIREIPINKISNITDAGKETYPVVEIK